MTKIFWLQGSRERIGPFASREAVERFIEMMALCGENWADTKIVEGGGDDLSAQIPFQMDSCSNRGAGINMLKLVGRRP